MSGITNPKEEYFKDGIWGWDPAAPGQWRKLIIDPVTNRLVIDHPGAITVEQTTPGSLTPGIHGWDGTVWRKLPLLWGYSDRWHQALSDLDASAGEDSLTTTAVPDGEVWILENVSVQWVGTSCTIIELWAVQGATVNRLHAQGTPVSAQWELWRGRVTLAKDDYIEAHFWGLTALDNIYLNVSGYKMKVAE